MKLDRIKSSRVHTTIVMFLGLVLISLVSGLAFCIRLSAQVPTTLPPFTTDFDKYVAIAKPYIPPDVYARGYFETGLAGSTIENYVIVTFKISTVTKQELGWQESPDTKFTSTGYLPQDAFNELQFKIDTATGKLILKEALDRAQMPVITHATVEIHQSDPGAWPTIAASVALIGGLIVLLLGLRKSKRPQ